MCIIQSKNSCSNNADSNVAAEYNASRSITEFRDALHPAVLEASKLQQQLVLTKGVALVRVVIDDTNTEVCLVDCSMLVCPRVCGVVLEIAPVRVFWQGMIPNVLM